MKGSLATALLAWVLLFADSTVVLALDYRVRMVHVLHRNGVSPPTMASSTTQVCGSISCGSLTFNGMTMMSTLGAYIRVRYNDASIVGSSPFFPSEQYSLATVNTRSLGYPRSIQSAAAFLRGVFPSKHFFYPVIYTVNATSDLTLNSDAFPPVMFKRYVDTEAAEEAVLQPTLDQRLTWVQIQAMAQEAHLTGCTQAKRGACVVKLYELSTYYAATNTIADKPNLNAGQSRLAEVAALHQRYLFDYNATDPIQKEKGSAGQFIALEMIAHMTAFQSAGSDTRVYHYSVEDAMLAPLSALLGDTTTDSMLPSYGTTFTVELLQCTADQSYHVRVARLKPTVGDYTVQSAALAAGCQSADGAVYTAGENGCPFPDFVRYVKGRSPSIKSGYCIVDQSQKDMLNCPNNQRSRRGINPYCELYREICPALLYPDSDTLSTANDMRNVTGTKQPEFYVRMVQVVHRHGARAPIVSFNRTQICGTEYPCGYLNAQGQAMLRAVGRYVRTRYNNLSIVENPLFPSKKYNDSIVYTRSTGVQRTIQSAATFLHEVFPDPDSFFPVIFSVNMTTDFLLNSDPMPSIMLKRCSNDAGLQAAINPVVDRYFTWEQLQRTAADAYAAGTCVDESYRYQCALFIYDIGTSFQATGRLQDHPDLAAAMDGAIAVNTAYFNYLFSYDPTDALQQKQGTMAQNLVQEMLGNIQAYLLAPSYSMFEYSTHDSVVAPLGVTLGDQSIETFEVPYAHTYILELLQNTTSGNYNVRVQRGYPTADDTHGTTFTYHNHGFPQKCMDIEGTTYSAGENGCPLEDFKRFTDSSKESIPNGHCHVNSVMYKNMQCPVNVKDPRPLHHNCQIYRIACPSVSCSEGDVLNAADLQCYSSKDVDLSDSTGKGLIFNPDLPKPTPSA